MTTSLRRAGAMVVALDLALGVILMMGAILALMTISKSQTPPRVETLGYYAVVITWPNTKAQSNDVDLYVQDPNGAIVYFENPDAGQMHLEHDDLGIGNTSSQYKGLPNTERVILRGITPGEYTVNLHMYQNYTNKPTTVTVTLWRLRGNDRVITQTKVTLGATGDEQTAFRFTLNKRQDVTNINHLQKRFVGQTATGTGGTPPPAFGGYGLPGNGTQAPTP